MRNRQWVFGKNAGLNFTSGSPVPFSNKPINTYEGTGCISDPITGNLLLYSDGVTVRDGSGAIKVSGLMGNQSSTQAALIVPDPGNKKRYYVFTSDGASGGNNHFNGKLINTSPWSSTPLSSLMTMPPTAGFSPTEKLVGVLHANKKDFWVLTIVQRQTATPSDTGPGVLRVFRVTSTGVSYVGDRPFKQDVSDIGYMKASKGGQYLAIANLWLKNVLVIPFSNSAGTIAASSLIKIPVTVPPFGNGGFVYGVEFSPTGRYIYYSTLFPLPIAASPTSDSHIFQFLLPSGPPILVGTHPNDKAGDVSLGALQLGSDNRIYIAQDGEKKLGVIAQPDLPGTACGLTFSALSLSPASTCNVGLPNLIRDLF